MRGAVPMLILAVLLLGATPPAFAQGCAMCRTSAAATEEPGQAALDWAILVLLIPTTSIFGGVLYWAYRNRNRSWNDTPVADPTTSPPSEAARTTAWRR